MAKRIIRTGTTADPTGDSLKNAFVKVNDNFTELYNALGLDADLLNLGAFEFTGSVMTTTDSSAIVIDQATTITSNLSVGGDIVPQTANGGDLGSLAKPWRSLYVSNNTIFLGGVPLGLDASNNLTVNGSRVGTTSYNDLTSKPTIPTSFSSLVNGDYTASLDSGGGLTIPGDLINPDGFILNAGGRGSLAIGKFIEVPGVEEHFHIAFPDSNVEVPYQDLYLGNDWNYVKIRGSHNEQTMGVDIGVEGQRWEFNPEGYVTFPDATVQTTAWTGIANALRSEGNINIEINLSDSTKRIWQFGEDGLLTFPDGTSQSTAGGGGSTLVNGANTVSLGTDGVLTLPEGSTITDTASAPGWNNGQAVEIKPGGASNVNQLLKIYPTVPSPDGNHIHITSGDLAVTDLFLGNDQQFVQIAADGKVCIGTYDIAGHFWQFGTDGVLTLPNGAVIKDNAGDSVAFGQDAGSTSQGANAVAIGTQAGNSDQGIETVAIGALAGINVQGQGAVAVGFGAGYTLQGVNSVAIGKQAGLGDQGNAAVAIGYRAGYTSQAANTIILNASGVEVNGVAAQTNSFYVAPIRTDATPGNVLYYNTATKEVTYGSKYSLPTATTSVLGGVKVDGTSVTISGGVISLNAGLSGSVTFKGGWNANTNTPTLVNGAGTAGWMYIVTTSGVSNLGAGLTSFSSGDLVIYDGTNWINVAANNGVVSFNSRTGAVTLTSTDVTTALGFTPYSNANPNSYISSITSGNVTTALGFTPYNATNPNSYIAASSLSISTNTASGAGSLSYSAGVFTFTPAVAYTLPTATPSVLGGIKIDNNTIVINDGVISVGGALTSATIFKGSWDASTNTPTLSSSLPAGVAAGWQYIVSVGATRDIGAGSTVYTVGDLVIYNGTTWSRIPGGNTVTAFNSRQGAITLTSTDVTTALGFTPISLASVSNYQFSVAADDSTQRLISSDEVVKFVGAGGVTTASDAEGAITITGPDLSTYATQSYVTTRGYLTTVDYNNLTNKPEIPQQFTFNVAGDDSTMRTIGSEETIKFIGSGGITTTTDAEGNVNIILGSLNAVNLVGTTLATSVVNSSLTSVGTLTRLNVTRDITARGFNTDAITMIGNRIATTVTNSNLEIEFSGTGGLVANNVADATTASTAKSVGYLGLPQSGTSTTATLAMSDAGKHIYITSTGQTITIPAASSVAYPIGTTLTFIAGSSATTTTIAITTDTLRLAGGTSTGSRTLAANGMATAVKVSGASSSGVWYINGTGLT